MFLLKPLELLQSQVTLSIFDSVFALAVVGPATVGYWRGGWNLMEIYLFPEEHLKSSLISLGVGFGGMLLMCLGQGPIKRFMKGKSKVCFILVSTLYTEIYGLFCINSWRGAWLFGDLFAKLPIEAVATITFLAILILASIKALRNTSAPPCAIVVGNTEDYFDTPTYFNQIDQKNLWTFILDCCFSVLFIGTLIVVVWRGTWVVVESILFPDDTLLSVLSSLIIGYSVTIITYSLEPLVHFANERLQGIWKYIVLDIYAVLIVFGALNVWRSLWHLLDTYFMPDYPLLGNWLSHVVSLALLMLLNCGNSVLVRGVCKDADPGTSDKLVVMPTHYLRIYFKNEDFQKTNETKSGES